MIKMLLFVQRFWWKSILKVVFLPYLTFSYYLTLSIIPKNYKKIWDFWQVNPHMYKNVKKGKKTNFSLLINIIFGCKKIKFFVFSIFLNEKFEFQKKICRFSIIFFCDFNKKSHFSQNISILRGSCYQIRKCFIHPTTVYCPCHLLIK